MKISLQSLVTLGGVVACSALALMYGYMSIVQVGDVGGELLPHVLRSGVDLTTLARYLPPEPAAPAIVPDPDYDAFTACTRKQRELVHDDRKGAGQWKFTEDMEAGEKTCLIVAKPIGIPDGVVFGPVSTFNYNGDFGYWFDAPGTCRPVSDGLGREVLRGKRTFCTTQLDFLDLPPTHRIIPLWEVSPDNSTFTIGFKIRRQARPWECPSEVNTQHALCQPPSPTHFKFAADGAPIIEPFEDVVRKAAARANGTVTFTVATYDYAEGAMLWYNDIFSKGLESGVVVAMDWGAFKYLVHRNIPATLMTTSLPLDVCCLRRFKMVPWRATNDIKTRAIIQALKMGLRVLMLDMDASPNGPALRPDGLLKDNDLIFFPGYSFMYTMMNPTPATIDMWTHVLEEVHRGGWDQTQYGYWASTMSDRIKQFAINQAFIPRSQNAFDQIELKRMQKLLDTTAWSHPDYPQGVRRQFVTWANDSQCAQLEDAPGSWVWRQQCMAGLLIAATATGRTALVHQAMSGVYNLGHIQRWFLVMVEDRALLLGSVSNDSVTTGGAHTLTAEYISQWHMLQEQPLVSLVDTPEALSAAARAALPPHNPASTTLQRVVDMVVGPTPAGRLSLACMRRGGPLTEENPNPTCTKA